MRFTRPKKRSLRFMSRFDAMELHACVEHTENGATFIEQDDDVKEPTMFSVYGHLKMGHVSCLEDFKTHRAALAWMKKEAASCKFELGYEDYWAHGKKEQSRRRRRSGRGVGRVPPPLDEAQPRRSHPAGSPREASRRGKDMVIATHPVRPNAVGDL